MRVAVVGGGPAGLYFALLLKKSQPDHDVRVFERNPAGATYGWGVVFSDRTLTSFREADYKTYVEIADDFVLWDAIDVRYRGGVVRCEGQGFSGIARKRLLAILQRRCAELGVQLDFEVEARDVSGLGDFDLLVGADGIRSVVRDAHAKSFGPSFEYGTSKYIWFGTHRPFDSFTFAFRENDHGLFQAHAYPFDGDTSTFIVETDEETWRRAELDSADEAESIAYCEKLFSDDLSGHALMSNKSSWISFVTLKNKRWQHGRVVLLGDAAHTAHFSIGSGTKLAMEDAIALAAALTENNEMEAGLSDYEVERKPRVDRFQEAARQSQTYFESTRRYLHMEPLQFSFHLLTRSGRVDYDSLRVGDPHFVGAVDRWFAMSASPVHRWRLVAPPPAFVPFEVKGMTLGNRVALSPPPTYSASDGIPGVQDGATLEVAAEAGAGLILTDIAAVSRDARITPASPGMFGPEHVDAWRQIVRRVHSSSDARICLRLGHAGPRGATRPRQHASDVPLGDGWDLVSASAIAYTRRSQVPHAAARADMDRIRDDFVAATERSRNAGFDALEVHMAHGYLLATFISPLTNKRDDAYGGSLDNRMRFPLEVVDAVRAAWPDGPLFAAISADDWATGGVGIDEAVAISRLLHAHGCDVIEVLAGQTTARSRPRYDPYFLVHYSDRIRNEADITTLSSASLTTTDDVNTVVAGGRADLCILRSTDANLEDRASST